MKAIWARLPEHMPNANRDNYIGMPPELTGGIDYRQRLPLARYLLLVELPDGYYMLFRFASGGEDGGDTWHQTLEDAYHQVRFEFPDATVDWRDVPTDNMEDAIDWLLSAIPPDSNS